MCRISKTEYISGSICEKRLWLEKHKPEVCVNTETMRKEEGDEVGRLAREYFPGAVTVQPGRTSVMAAETKRLIDSGATVICEATFAARGLSCATDIVLVHPDGLDIIEVKSSTSIKDVQRDDVSFQCHVVLGAGYNIRRVRLMHLNKEYIRRGELSLQELFTFTELDVPTQARTGEIQAKAEILEQICEQMSEPTAPLELRCEIPHACPCRGYCHAQAGIPEESVFTIPGLNKRKRYELYRMGVVSIEQASRAHGLLTPKQAGQVQGMLGNGHGADMHIDKAAVRRFLAALKYPLAFLDFESYQRAIPQYEGVAPFMQVPFQYSLHIKASPQAEPRHREHLAEAKGDPRRALAEQLCRDFPPEAQGVAYNRSFERSICRHLAEMYPDLRQRLLSIGENLVDLMIPFRSRWIQSPTMHGSYSLKAVLPALCNDDPTLDYSRLSGVHNGAEASECFITIQGMKTQSEVQAARDGLLKYCGLDTLAMSKILDKMYLMAYQ